MRVLGVSCDYHDAAAALLVDGELISACAEERLSRVKHDSTLPSQAMAACLAAADIGFGDVDVVVFHEKPLVVASRFLAARQRVGPRAVPRFVREFPNLIEHNLMIKHRLEAVFEQADVPAPPVFFGEHHLSHASAAYLASPFPSAAIITYDGIGEWTTASFGRGSGHKVDLMAEMRFPDSLGLLYSLITLWCGFQPNDGEYKVMGLAPYGAPTYAAALRKLVGVHDDGSFEVDARRLRWWSGRPHRSQRLARLFDGPPRATDEPITAREADLARSMQELVEEILLRTAHHVADATGESTLCMAGGVALNCVANSRLLSEGPFDDIWIQPAAGDDGSALGAALWYWHVVLGNPRRREDGTDLMRGAALGPSFEATDVDAWLKRSSITSVRIADVDERCAHVADRLAQGAIVGWFDGAMEFGPRALGCRSILADPRSATMQRDLNLRVKGRESFRPFAPAVLWEQADQWFEIDRPSPYMTFTHQVSPDQIIEPDHEPVDLVERAGIARSTIPACTHVDGSARVQTVHADLHPTLHPLLVAFAERTGCPVLVNTSFNRAGDPIVCTPDDALATARASGLDLLVVGEHVVEGPAFGA